MLLKNQTLMGRWVHRQFGGDFANPKTGSPLQVRKPNRYTVTEGAVLSIQDSTEQYTTIPQPSQKHVAMAATSKEMTMEIEEYSARHIVPAVAQLSNHIDYTLTGLYNQVPLSVGVPGTDPNAFSIVNNAATAMSALGVPNDGQRRLVLNAEGQGSMADAFKGFFDQNLTQDAIRRGETGRISGFEVGMSQNVRRHTTGVISSGTPLVNGASTAGDSTIVSDGWGTSVEVMKAGDIFTIANVFEVNPMNRDATSQLKQFVSLTDVTSNGSGQATIQVMPSGDSGPGLQGTGAYKNVSALPADNAAITVAQAAGNRLGGNAADSTLYAQNLAFHKDAFALVMFDLAKPQSADCHVESDPDNGYSIRCVRDYDITNDREILRLDILFSVAAHYPDLACRIWGN